MKRVVLVTLAVAILGTMFVSTAWAADPPADRVVVMYFHRTKRCPTCSAETLYTLPQPRVGQVPCIVCSLAERMTLGSPRRRRAILWSPCPPMPSRPRTRRPGPAHLPSWNPAVKYEGTALSRRVARFLDRVRA